ncbi:baseplate J/gp47 family protein [Pseudomonas veronii]|uniref:Baseplate J/gp47 family protein n=1 Tax=Pseudomonas veronii TaxID=76761 RepID=A0A5M8EU01_PSEVE|nr:baseplate J/gp47 family protein [Pseudomonas veronii]KAA6172702.1 baseplate J/gp47 family protein [Pseudomonas veronii]KAA6174309.1 baseplate J/gp47 family protein [Pseudomonas veronii]
MAFSAPNLETILAGILRDIKALNDEADIGTDSDHYIRSAAIAAAIEGIYQKLAWLYRQIFPDTADVEELVHAAGIRGVQRKAPVAATGVVALKGTASVELLQGSTLTHRVTGEQFDSLVSATLGIDGTTTVLVKAHTVGSSLNRLTGDLVLTSPPLGMDANASFVGATTGGEDQESPESLLARLLDVIQSPPAGGNLADFKRWAKEVDGVADVLVIPKRRSGNSIDLVLTGSTGSPSAEVIARCLDHVTSVCSVFADVWAYPPAERRVNSSALVELAAGYTLAGVQASAQAGYNALLGALKPSETLKRSHIETMIGNLAGVVDRALTAPAGNVLASDDPSLIGWIRPGTIILGLLK